jgi:hypothetical protein
MSNGSSPYPNNSTITVQVPKNPLYKGNFDEESFQKAGGGTLIIGPLDYQPYATSGIGTDTWQITSIDLKINPTATPDNTNPIPIGGNTGKGQGIQWALMGANQVNLNSGTKNSSTLFFDANFNPAGNH